VERADPGLSERILMRLNIAHGLLVAYSPMSHASNIEDILLRSLRTAEDLDDLESQLLALWGLSTVKMKHGDHRAGQEIAERIRSVSLRGDAADRALGDRAVGTASYYAGNQPEARRCLERILELPLTAAREDYEAWLLTDLRIQSEAMLARVLLLQGCADQAWQHARACFEQARTAGRAMSICFTLRYAVCGVSLTLGDIAGAEPAVSLLVEVATRHNFTPWMKLSHCLQGMLAIRRGDLAPGTVRLREAIDANMKVGFTLCYPEMLGFLASGLIGLGRWDEARRTLQSAIEWSDRTGECWYLPELWRLEGELAMQGMIGEAVEAEAAFIRAIRLAQEQGALLWELRAACSLTRLRIAQRRPDEAFRLLAPLYAQFNEGIGSGDLCVARGLLDALTPLP
jgi:tetratricopeptide (TPR) repeat protein